MNLDNNELSSLASDFCFIKWVDIYISYDNACTYTLQNSEGSLLGIIKGHDKQKTPPKKLNIKLPFEIKL